MFSQKTITVILRHYTRRLRQFGKIIHIVMEETEKFDFYTAFLLVSCTTK